MSAFTSLEFGKRIEDSILGTLPLGRNTQATRKTWKLLEVASILLLLLTLAGWAQEADKAYSFPLKDENARVTSAFGAFGAGLVSDPNSYLPGQFHLGTDLAAAAGADVLSPADGKIVYYHRRSNRSRQPQWMNTFMVIRDLNGNDWILGHVECTICDSSILIGDEETWPIDKQVDVVAGRKVGVIADLKAEAVSLNIPHRDQIGNHLHLGVVGREIIDQDGRLKFPYLGGDWGRIKYGGSDRDAGPASMKIAVEKGFKDPLIEIYSDVAAQENSEGTEGFEWGAGLIAGVDVGWNPCGNTRESDTCLRQFGLGDEAIAFSKIMDNDYSGSTVGISFRELGKVDLAVAQFIGNDVYEIPVLVNGVIGWTQVLPTEDLRGAFRDEASQAMLDRFPQAVLRDSPYISSHRLLPDGTQRFVLVEGVVDGCRACDILGSAVSFVEVGPTSEGTVTRMPVGLLLGPPEEGYEQMKSGTFFEKPSSLQVALNSLGYYAGSMDGRVGQMTTTALREFQRDYCLEPSGTLDARTAVTLLEADGFNRPCLESVSAAANTAVEETVELLPGTYVSDQRFCTNPEAANPFRDIRVIGFQEVDHGVGEPCFHDVPVSVGGALEYSANCVFSEPDYVATWRWRPVGPSEFVEERGLFPESPDAPWGLKFSHCSW